MTQKLSQTQRWTISRLAYWHLDRGRLAEAEALARGLIALDNRDGMGWLYYGEARRQQGDLDGAVQGFEQALRWMPDRADLWLRLGKLFIRLGRLEEARRALEKARATADDGKLLRRVEALLNRSTGR